MIKLNKIIINKKVIRDTVDNALVRVTLVPAKLAAEKLVKAKKEEFLHEFINHEVSEEILAGPDANYGVGDINGNLFSFLGFSAGSTPVQDLYNYFKRTIKLGNGYRYNKGTKTYTFNISYPTIDEIKDYTDLGNYTDDDWGSGRSWAISIERGIPGLSRYKFSLDEKVLGGESRSGTALQRKNNIHPGSTYKIRSYISELLKILYK